MKAISEWELRHAIRHYFPAPVRCSECGALLRDVLRVFPEAGQPSDGGLWRWVCVPCALGEGVTVSAAGSAYLPGGCCHDDEDGGPPERRAVQEASAASRREGEA